MKQMFPMFIFIFTFDSLHETQRIGLPDRPLGAPDSGQQIPVGGRIKLGVAFEYLNPALADAVGEFQVEAVLVVVVGECHGYLDSDLV